MCSAFQFSVRFRFFFILLSSPPWIRICMIFFYGSACLEYINKHKQWSLVRSCVWGRVCVSVSASVCVVVHQHIIYLTYHIFRQNRKDSNDSFLWQQDSPICALNRNERHIVLLHFPCVFRGVFVLLIPTFPFPVLRFPPSFHFFPSVQHSYSRLPPQLRFRFGVNNNGNRFSRATLSP